MKTQECKGFNLGIPQDDSCTRQPALPFTSSVDQCYIEQGERKKQNKQTKKKTHNLHT